MHNFISHILWKNANKNLHYDLWTRLYEWYRTYALQLHRNTHLVLGTCVVVFLIHILLSRFIVFILFLYIVICNQKICFMPFLLPVSLVTPEWAHSPPPHQRIPLSASFLPLMPALVPEPNFVNDECFEEKECPYLPGFLRAELDEGGSAEKKAKHVGHHVIDHHHQDW